VIYVVKENRSFDQVLGDLKNGANVDPSLTQFGASITPNLHSLATNFVTLDNFMESGDSTGEGWPWLMQRDSPPSRNSSILTYIGSPPPNFAGPNGQGYRIQTQIH
jgi:hypothetical protein